MFKKLKHKTYSNRRIVSGREHKGSFFLYTLPRFCEQKKEQFKLPFKLLSGYYNKFVKQQKQKLSYKKN